MSKKEFGYDILYVEDENEVRKNYVEYLERFFSNVYEASSAEEAYKKYKSLKPSILIIDINLPQMSGIELLQMIRKEDYQVKAIMLTANSDVATLLSASELKLSKYLVKPISRSDLKSALTVAVEEIQNYTISANKIIRIKESFYWNQEHTKLFQDKTEVPLTRKELDFLILLFSNTNKIFSSSDIMFELWQEDDASKMASLKTLIKGLRKKLPKGTIKNLFGFGYKIETE